MKKFIHSVPFYGTDYCFWFSIGTYPDKSITEFAKEVLWRIYIFWLDLTLCL